MNRCPVTYESCGRDRYSAKGLRHISRYLTSLNDFPYTADEQRKEAIARSDKMSIQGVQLKLSARLNIKESRFDIVDLNGRYILKPQSQLYNMVPENEDLTMRLANIVGIKVPFHGLMYSKDGSLTYFIRRFDRIGRNEKVLMEDFAQLALATRSTKYESSMEKVAKLLEYCTFPVIEKLKLFKLTLFNYLVGNEDMHLKNFSLITHNTKTELSPAYDLLNTSIAIGNASEEIALPLKGKKRNLTRTDLIDYFGKEHLNLNQKIIDDVLKKFSQSIPFWQERIQASFLSPKMQSNYMELLNNRRVILKL
ncbi:HipA domain-containing protein [Caldithrix abyssi]|nr:HipA domain-containing protein [Caldithrix abyssi]